MSLKVILYQHNKKINSTMRPPSDALRKECEGVFLDGANVLHPYIAFKIGLNEPNLSIYNYARIVLFSNRFYFIDNWEHVDGRWVAHMSVDVLATYKDNIGSSRQYVLRSAARKNGYITDSLYPTTAITTAVRTDIEPTTESLWRNGANLKTGCYMVGVINNDPDAVGSVSYYVMTHTEIKKLLKALMGSFSWLNVTEVSQELTQALFNPFQYIVSCKWFPVEPDSGVSNVTISSLPYGWWVLPGVTGKRFSGVNTVRSIEGTINIPEHPEIQDNYFLNSEPFTECTAFFEPWGSFPLPCIPTRPSLVIYTNVDYITGRGTLSIETLTGEVVAYKEGVVGVDIQLSQMSTNVLGTMASAAISTADTIGSIFRGDIGGAISNQISGIVSTIENATPQLSTKGLNGSTLAYAVKPYLVTKFRNRVSTDNTRLGSPLCVDETIENLGGYILCANPSVELGAAMPVETEAVNRHLSEGFFYE